jgi:hypothetical protein
VHGEPLIHRSTWLGFGRIFRAHLVDESQPTYFDGAATSQKTMAMIPRINEIDSHD